MFKVNLDKLTDFERQRVVMFEMHLPKVGVSDNVLHIPDMPAIMVGHWPFAKVLPPPLKDAAATWYRHLSWRGQIVAHQLHKRALQRAVEAPEQREQVVERAFTQGQIVGTAASTQAMQAAANKNAQIMNEQMAGMLNVNRTNLYEQARINNLLGQ